jgi:AraC family transcriptional regulator
MFNPETCQIYFCSLGSLREGIKSNYCLPKLWALHYYLNSGKVGIGENERVCQNGTLSLTPPGVKSTYEPLEDFSYYCVHFEVEEDEELKKLGVFSDSPVGTEEFNELFLNLLSLSAMDGFRAKIRLLELLHLYKMGTVCGHASRSYLHPSIERVIVWMKSNLNRNPTLNELGNIAGVTGTHLNRLFNFEFNKTAMAYFHEEKMRRVTFLIQNSEQSLKSIALELGFPDLHAFNKAVKKSCGDGPRKFRDLVKRSKGTA